MYDSSTISGDLARIMDANANRAREALRVMEDHARFVLDDKGMTETLKALRHDLAAALRTIDGDLAVAFRDTPGDVGTEIGTVSEQVRTSPVDVVRAASKRLSEALRVLEEYGKIIDICFAARIEQLRYRGYDVEMRLVRIVNACVRFGQVRLYVLVTESLCRCSWQEVVRGAAAGGAGCFQLREKDLADRVLLERAREFCSVCREVDALCIINDRADIAVAAGADGVHVGQDDIDVASARRVVGPGRIVGVSTHSVEQAREAAAQCPDYIAVGPMFSTAIKPDCEVAGPKTLRAVRNVTSLPLLAIGGIDSERARDVAGNGASGMAVCSAVIGSTDPEAAAGMILMRVAEASVL